MEKTKKSSSVLSKIVDVIIWIFVIFAVVVTIMVFSMQNNADGIPSLFGKGMITISSNSMSTAIKTGDLIFIQTVTSEEAKDLEVGDVITFHSSQDINGDGYTGDIETHRIVDKNVSADGSVYFTTQGDNPEMCPLPDPAINASEVIGVMVGKPLRGLGSFISLLSTQTGFFFFVVLPMILFFLYGIINFVLVLMKNREKKPAEVDPAIKAAEEEEIKKRAIEEYLRQQAEAQAKEQAQKAEKTDEAKAPDENEPKDGGNA